MTTSLPAVRPFACHVMAKPSGAVCNLACEYCFYLEKEKLYPTAGQRWRMDDETLELYVRQYIEAQDLQTVNFAWQGGEPTLMGVDFYRRAVGYQKRYANGKTVTNAFQTNGVLLDDGWGEFFSTEQFLVGLSIDGPREMHDRYRVDKGGKPSFDRVMAGLEVLKRHRVEFNTLTVLNSYNAAHPLDVYRFLKGIGSRFMQFIPVVERVASGLPEHRLKLIGPRYEDQATVTAWSVGAEQYGQFLAAVCDHWVRHDVGTYFVQIFDTTLASWVGQSAGLCIFAQTCGDALIIEHNGDVYSCDHFVYPDYNLGNVHETTIREMAGSPRQVDFGLDKRAGLPDYCRSCEFLSACNGGCPKQRFTKTPEGESGLNYLCTGYKTFFGHVAPYMQVMAEELRRGRSAMGVMAWVQNQDAELRKARGRLGRNDPCHCGSGKKFKRCCWRN